MYIQNREFTGNEDISGDKIEIGYDVTTSIPKGDVILKDGADLKLNSTFGTIIKNGFKCEKGAKLTIN